jgi:competence protein ComEA
MKTSLTPEHKALIFVGCIGLLGAGVRVARALGPAGRGASAESAGLARLAPGTPQPALERQITAADSAAADTGADRRPRPRRRAPTSSRRIRVRLGRVVLDSSGPVQPRPIQPVVAQPGRGADDMAHVSGRLDVDAATAAQLDSLPGIGPAIANRIIADRAAHGAFGSMAGLMRVAGVGPAAARRLDPLVTFSGVAQPVTTGSESTFARPRRRRKPPSRPDTLPAPVS